MQITVLNPYSAIFSRRFLATGDSTKTIAFSYRVGKSTVTGIIKETCIAIWEELQVKVMKVPDQQMWKIIARDFEKKWNFPNCCGAIDGKHVVMRAPPNAGSMYFNYKGTHSIVLLAVVDANYCFTMIDVGAFGKSSDGGTFALSNIGKQLDKGTLQFPCDQALPGIGELPHVLVGDEAFPLKPYLLRPYPGRGATNEQRVFNYRLSRARRIVENAFGILAARWRIFQRTIQQEPETVDEIVKATCVLHNFLVRQSLGTPYCDNDFVDDESELGEIRPGGWRCEVGIECSTYFKSMSKVSHNRCSKKAFENRDLFCKYFSSTEGELAWQGRAAHGKE